MKEKKRGGRRGQCQQGWWQPTPSLRKRGKLVPSPKQTAFEIAAGLEASGLCLGGVEDEEGGERDGDNRVEVRLEEESGEWGVDREGGAKGDGSQMHQIWKRKEILQSRYSKAVIGGGRPIRVGTSSGREEEIRRQGWRLRSDPKAFFFGNYSFNK
ncbi:hypothetical protein PIB30_001046 [Stylosanthes scabra]|uniref:Uncharacterized protein n=1 Tax=Stylosanthes scabra TaxID=79078 RepID=A0ABU6T2E1_9FABA|nr:hypothetical protein [Stylosanthes scabra]